MWQQHANITSPIRQRPNNNGNQTYFEGIYSFKRSSRSPSPPSRSPPGSPTGSPNPSSALRTEKQTGIVIGSRSATTGSMIQSNRNFPTRPVKSPVKPFTESLVASKSLPLNLMVAADLNEESLALNGDTTTATNNNSNNNNSKNTENKNTDTVIKPIPSPRTPRGNGEDKPNKPPRPVRPPRPQESSSFPSNSAQSSSAPSSPAPSSPAPPSSTQTVSATNPAIRPVLAQPTQLKQPQQSMPAIISTVQFKQKESEMTPSYGGLPSKGSPRTALPLHQAQTLQPPRRLNILLPSSSQPQISTQGLTLPRRNRDGSPARVTSTVNLSKNMLKYRPEMLMNVNLSWQDKTHKNANNHMTVCCHFSATTTVADLRLELIEQIEHLLEELSTGDLLLEEKPEEENNTQKNNITGSNTETVNNNNNANNNNISNSNTNLRFNTNNRTKLSASVVLLNVNGFQRFRNGNVGPNLVLTRPVRTLDNPPVTQEEIGLPLTARPLRRRSKSLCEPILIAPLTASTDSPHTSVPLSSAAAITSLTNLTSPKIISPRVIASRPLPDSDKNDIPYGYLVPEGRTLSIAERMQDVTFQSQLEMLIGCKSRFLRHGNENSEIGEFCRNITERIQILLHATRKKSNNYSLAIMNAEVTTAPFPEYLSSTFLVTFAFPQSNHKKTINSKAEAKVQTLLNELFSSSHTKSLVQDGPENFVCKLCGSSAFLHPDQIIGQIQHVREILQRRKPIIICLLRKNDMEIELTNSIVPDDQVPVRTALSKVFSTERTYLHKDLKIFQPVYDCTARFEFRIISAANVFYHHASISDIPNITYFVEVGLYHGITPITLPIKTNEIKNPESNQQLLEWNHTLQSNIQICDIPWAARLCVTLYARKKLKEDVPLGWANHQLVDFRGVFSCGLVSLQLWLNGKANPIATCCGNVEERFPLTLCIEFPVFEKPVLYTPVPTSKQEHQLEPKYVEPTDAIKKRLLEAVNTSGTAHLTPERKKELWHYRHFLKTIPKALPKVLMSVEWGDLKRATQAIRLLPQWAPLTPVEALELLDGKFAAPEVRDYAVERLRTMSDRDLRDYLLQLVQVLKFEPYHDSPLARLLLQRALSNRIMIGHPLFWHLQAELHVPDISERYSLLSEMYLYGSGNHLNEIVCQKELVVQLLEIATNIKTFKDPRARVKSLHDQLSAINFPSYIKMTHNPIVVVDGILVDKCKIMDSATNPLWLAFRNADPMATSPVYLIFKCGDDLRQDILTLQMFRIMDKIWKLSGMDLGMTCYSCVSTGNSMGVIEVVPNAKTVAQIQKDDGGATAALSKHPLANWLRAQNADDEQLAFATENFVRSCAGYCVATYLLGIGDRHNDNIMVTSSGHMFHIDFAHFLGNVQKWQGFRRERAPFVFTPEFAHVMGGKNSEMFEQFVKLCCDAFLILREHANLFISLFSMMLSTGIPELTQDEDINYLRKAFLLDQTTEKARQTFKNLIFESLETKSTQLNFLIHNLAHRN